MKIYLNKKNINSFIVAMYICEVLIANVLSVFLVGLDHYPLYVMGIIVIVYILNNRSLNIREISKGMCLYISIIILFGLSAVINGIENISEYLAYFCSFGMVALFLSVLDIDYHKVLLYVVYIYSWFLIHYFIFFRSSFISSSGESYQSESMGIAYSLIVIVYIFWLLLLYRDEIRFSKFQKIICVICSCMALFVILFDCGTRGPALCCLVGLLVAFLGKIKGGYKGVALLFLIILMVYCYLNIAPIVQMLSKALDGLGFHVNFFDKILWFIQKGDLSNGRTQLYESAIELILKRPLTGYGIGYFESVSSRVYVHNYFLELLCDFGIIGTFFFVYYIIHNLKDFVVKNKDDKSLFVFVLMSSFVALMFSNSFWLSPLYWYMFFFVFRHTKMIRIKRTLKMANSEKNV